METVYDVSYFIKKFEAIPENRIIENILFSGDSCCANGWCGIKSVFDRTSESDALQIVFSELSCPANKDDPQHPNYSNIAANINNGWDLRYTQPTAKQRILAALRDIKEKMIKEQEDKRSVANTFNQGVNAGYIDITKSLAILPEEKPEVDLIVKEVGSN